MTTRDMPAPVQGGDVFAGKYVVDRVIGSGAMGIVVAANHVQLDEKVVLKFLRAEVAQRPDVVARFLREARAAVRIHNEHVVRILDVGTTESGLPYIVMEHLDGCDLQQLLRARGALPVADAVEYVAQTCLAMAQAHAVGVVHRDLKPSNLFLCQRGDGSPLIKVLDFGISKVIADAGDQTDLTSTNGILGSPIYISPEQARSARSVDARADVWSLGVILHHLLTGQPPFVGESVTEVLSAILFAAPRRLCEARPEAPAALEAIVLRCLEKEVERRTPSVVKLAVALAPWAQPGSRAAISRIASPGPSVSDAIAPSPAPAVEAGTPTVGTPTRGMTGGASGGVRFGRGGVAKMVGLAIALVLGGTVATTLLARHRAPAHAALSPMPLGAESMGATRQATSDESMARSSARIEAALPAGRDLADATGAGGASGPPPPELAARASKPSRSNPSRAPTSAVPGKTSGPQAPIDPGSLTFDLGTALPAGHATR